MTNNRQILIGIIALLLGTIIYLTDRPPGKVQSYDDSLDGVWAGTIDGETNVSVELRDGQIYGSVGESDYSDAASPISQDEITGSYYFSDDNTIVTDLNLTDDGELISSETEVFLNQAAEDIDSFNVVFNERKTGDSSSAVFTDAASDGQSDIFGDISITYKDNDLDTGYLVAENLWIRAVIHTEEKGPIEAVLIFLMTEFMATQAQLF